MNLRWARGWGMRRLQVGVAGVCAWHPSTSPSALWRIFNTHTWNKKKLLMSLARLPWELAANESLGFPFTFAELHRAGFAPRRHAGPLIRLPWQHRH